ncbi:hypothetical protein CSPB12327_05885 [Campylobacter sp. RM12327]|uniref:hypothetical protein n=1 Tax=Campylobacter sputorum TaxID=206 RepID=UPI000B787E8E|nr:MULTISPECIES: hypothetical protein [Campylobacter]ASM40785.1 hypothetical protein CSPB_1620 [Campylobacter sputorum]MBE7357907.1 hypothetical protein [Campylobacter sp. RM11302]MBF6669666.1 hypothetical protein [Campylobacter sp. RM12327]MBF6674809.1 hypothetical protein [Campylobacter sp. RM13538]MBF6675753.1 hypothetical protein [Campylobacter sp. RM12321]
MALPFIAGLAVGSLAVVAFNNKDKIKDKLLQGYEKGKEVAQDLKECAENKLKSSKDKCCDCEDEKDESCDCKCHNENQKNTSQIKKSSTKNGSATLDSKKPSSRSKKTTSKGE